MLATDVRIRLEGAHNFRDLGGYRTGSGRKVRCATLFRADALHALTDVDLQHCQAFRLRTAIDLRSAGEREEEPSRLGALAGIRTVEVPLASALHVADEAAGGEVFLLALYRGLLIDAAPTIGSILSVLAEPGALPAVFNCSAGKDRTGVLSAVILLALGVAERHVLDDYEITSRYRSEDRVRKLLVHLEVAGLSPELAAGLMGTPRWVLQTALRDVIGDAGIDDYLLGRAGMTHASLGRLRKALTEVA